jgi:hypothetical protein
LVSTGKSSFFFQPVHLDFELASQERAPENVR